MPSYGGAHWFVRRHGGLLLAAGLALSADLSPATGQTIKPTELVRTGTLGPTLQESSGIAVSRHQPGVLWTHNDSGGEAAVYAITLRGEVLAEVGIRDATNRDWEDLSLGPCLVPVHDRDCLYIADTGDNSGRRSSVAIYVVAEPRISPSESGDRVQRFESEPAKRIRLTYRPGPADVEAVAVSPGGDMILVSKGRRGRNDVYRVDRRRLQIAAETGELMTLRTIGTLSLPRRSIADLVTGAAISPSGLRLVVRTYRDLYFYRMEDAGLELEGPACRVGAVEPQGEAVDFLTESRLVLSSEALGDFPATIYTVKCD